VHPLYRGGDGSQQLQYRAGRKVSGGTAEEY
jgi:hypothetical protein